MVSGRPAGHLAPSGRPSPGRKLGRRQVTLPPEGIDVITEFWNWINDGAGPGGVGLHEWEEAHRLVERGERKLSYYGGELPGIEPPEECKRYFDWQRQFRLSEFSSGEWFELAKKMFEYTGDNVFVIGTVDEAPNILITNNDLRKGLTESRSPTPTGTQPAVLGRPTLVR